MSSAVEVGNILHVLLDNVQNLNNNVLSCTLLHSLAAMWSTELFRLTLLGSEVQHFTNDCTQCGST